MKKYILLLSIIFAVTSCEVDETLNIDKKNPTVVPASGLFSNAAINMFDLLNGWHANRLYAQYWAQTTYPETSQYTQSGLRNNIWSAVYQNVLQDLKGAREIITEEGGADSAAQLGIINFMEVFAFSVLVDTYGNVPYSEALDTDNASPVYDDASTIYADLLTRIDAAISSMGSGRGFSAGQDPIYGGDMSQWKKAANALKLRLAMRLADVNTSVAGQKAAEAAAGAIADNADNFGLNYLPDAPNTNPVWVDLVQSGRIDYVGANTFIDVLNDLNDPRRPAFFETRDGVYSGGIYGTANAASSFSAISNLMKKPDLKGNIISAAEVHFLLAEAAARGFNVPGTEADHYHAGIAASIEEWGGSATDVADYLAQESVAYETATGDWKTKIATQKWIAMYNIPYEGWTTWRLLDKPILNVVEGLTYGDIPTRILYPTDEAQLNGTSLNAAISAIGGDLKTVKIFWDVN